MGTAAMKEYSAETLREAGYIENFAVVDDGPVKKILTLTLKYKGRNSDPVIEGIRRVSKPSCRVYVSGENLFTITKYSGMDPEMGGYDTIKYPVSRVFAFGIKLNY